MAKVALTNSRPPNNITLLRTLKRMMPMIKARQHHAGFFFFALLFLLLFFSMRILALYALPLHNDEGLHLTRAVEVWNGNPFWEIRDGKIINHWLIAAFYPQNAPVFVGRIATVFVALIGVAGMLAILRRYGMFAVAIGALLWIASPLMFFYDRMAFSDMQAGALGLLALWAAGMTIAGGTGDPPGRPSKELISRQTDSGNGRDKWRPYTRDPVETPFIASAVSLYIGLITAFFLSLALLFKFTAAPYALGVALLVLTRREPLDARLRTLAIITAGVVAAFAAPVAVLLMRGSSLFDIALDWVGAGGAGGSATPTLIDNLGRLASLLWWGNPFHAIVLFVGVLGVMLRKTAETQGTQRSGYFPTASSAPLRFNSVYFVLACLIPMAAILVLGRDAQSRHFAVAMPPLVVVAGIGWGWMIRWRVWRANPLHIVIIIALFIPFVPFAANAYRDPAALAMPPLMAWQYVEGYASGYGLREAVETFPQTLDDPTLQNVGSMYGDSCRRANFYGRVGRTMLCGDAPMRAAIEAALARDGAVYVLVERGGEIGIDVATLDARATLIASYPRPHETVANASVRLWRVER
jgi:hypothetical protein